MFFEHGELGHLSIPNFYLTTLCIKKLFQKVTFITTYPTYANRKSVAHDERIFGNLNELGFASYFEERSLNQLSTTLYHFLSTSQLDQWFLLTIDIVVLPSSSQVACYLSLEFPSFQGSLFFKENRLSATAQPVGSFI